jgi:hypothetical protein
VEKRSNEFIGAKKFRYGRLDISAQHNGFPVRFDLRGDQRVTVTAGGDEVLEALRGTFVTQP